MSKKHEIYQKLEMTITDKVHTIKLTPKEVETFYYRLFQKKDGTLCLQQRFLYYKNPLSYEYKDIWKDVETVKEQQDD